MSASFMGQPCFPQSRIMRPERVILENGHTYPLCVTREHEARRALDPANGRLGACLTILGNEDARS